MLKYIVLGSLLPLANVVHLNAMRRQPKQIHKPVIEFLTTESSIPTHSHTQKAPSTWYSSRLFKKTTQDSVMPLIGKEKHKNALALVKQYNNARKDNRPLFNQKQSQSITRVLNNKAQEKQKAINTLTHETCRKFALMPLVMGTLVSHPIIFEAAVNHPLISIPLAFTQTYGLWGIAEQALLSYNKRSLNTIVDLQKELSASSPETKELSVQ